MAANRTQREADRKRISERVSLGTLRILFAASLLSTVVVSTELINPTITTKAVWLRSFILLALPFYIYLLTVDPKKRRNLVNPLTLAVVAFTGVSLLAALFGVNPFHSVWSDYTRMGGVYHLLHLTLLYFYLLTLVEASGRVFLRTCLQGLVGLASASGLYAIGVAVGMSPWVPDFFPPDRISSLYGNPIFFAGFLILPMTLTIFLWLQAERLGTRYLYASGFLVQLIGVLLTRTRGAIVGIIAGTLIGGILLVLRRQKQSNRYAILLVTAAVAAAVVLAIAGDRLPSSFQRIASFNDLEDRLVLWRIAWKGFLERPLLGVGPENYYFVFNKYYDPRLYVFPFFAGADRAHNQLLETLVTTGVFGLMTYLGMCSLIACAFYKAFRAKVITWNSMVVLISGLVVYCVQNFFAFDTPATGVTFYLYAGFAGSLWTATQPLAMRQQELSQPNKSSRAAWVFWTAALASTYLVFMTDWGTIASMRSLAKAEVADSPESARLYLETAAHSSFLYDRGELAGEYTRFVEQLSFGTAYGLDPSFISGSVDKAIAALEQTTRHDATRPEIWLDLAYLYRLESTLTKTRSDPRVNLAIGKGMALAPWRFDLWSFALQNAVVDSHRRDAAVAFAQHMSQRAPHVPETAWLLALAYHYCSDREDLAVQTAKTALHLGYEINLSELDWLLKYYNERHEYAEVSKLYEPAALRWRINYYADRQNYRKVVDLYRQAVQAKPDDFRLYERLAAAYAKLGENDKAIDAATEVLRLHPAAAGETERWLRTLQ